MEQYEAGMAGAEALKKLKKAEPEIVDEYFGDDGTMDAFYRYESGGGFLRVDNFGLLYWEDNEEQEGESCIFEKSSDDVW